MKPLRISCGALIGLVGAYALYLHAASAQTPAAESHVLAWWRFEDGSAGHWLDAGLGHRRPPFSVTADSSGNGDPLRTFNTRPRFYPPDTSPAFSDDVPTDLLQSGLPDHHSMHFNGKQYLYTMNDRLDLQLLKQKEPAFTIEGMFKLAVLPGDYTTKTQVILCKVGSPVVEPLIMERSPQLNTTQPTTRRAGHGTTRPTTYPATTQATQPSEDLPTELPNDHPPQPVVCYVGGERDCPGPLNRFVVTLLDASKKQHYLVSRSTLYARHWYAFAIVCDGEKADLYLSDLSDRGYEVQSTATLRGGLYRVKGIWNLGCGMVDDLQDYWYQGWIDEIRISAGIVDREHFLATDASRARPKPAAQVVDQTVPSPTVKGLADPALMKFNGTYYLYGTRDQSGYPVYTSTDLLHWTRGPVVFEQSRGMWGESRFWAPSVIAYHNKFYLFYSALGALRDSGFRHSHRVCIARSDSPLGPFKDFVAPLPLTGKAAIDPEAFIDNDGKPFLYFVSDCSENVTSQIFAVRLNEDLTGTVGEPVLCLQPSQVWEGTMWNEGPSVFRAGDIYVLLYSANWWHSADYGVGFATSRSPLGPWTKNPDNPILQHYRGLKGTGGADTIRDPENKLMIFFHAQGPPGSQRRDTYCDRLVVKQDSRLGVMLKVESDKAADFDGH
jgi:GH43 family beta-xylosidase